MIARARVVRGSAAQAEPLWGAGPSPIQFRRVARETLAAKVSADALLEQARADAAAVRSRSLDEARDAVALAVQAAEERADAVTTARWLALRQEELRRTDKDIDRVVPLAVALAERLLGSALEVDPARVAALARTVFEEARGARRARVDAHPSDAHILRDQLTTAGLDVQSIEIREDSGLGRGDLRLHTDVGTIDARLAPRFERLAAALRDALS